MGVKIKLRYQFPATRVLCQAVIEEGDAEARKGAQAVLNCLESRQLLRGSQPDTSKLSQELVRPVIGSDMETKPETLLRAGEKPEQEANPSPAQPTRRQRLFGNRNGAAS